MAVRINLPTMVDFWAWLARLAWRRAVARLPEAEKPVGLPHNRDPQNPCDFYEPRPRTPFAWKDCESDGHYLCQQCCRLKAPEHDEDES